MVAALRRVLPPRLPRSTVMRSPTARATSPTRSPLPTTACRCCTASARRVSGLDIAGFREALAGGAELVLDIHCDFCTTRTTCPACWRRPRTRISCSARHECAGRRRRDWGSSGGRSPRGGRPTPTALDALPDRRLQVLLVAAVGGTGTEPSTAAGPYCYCGVSTPRLITADATAFAGSGRGRRSKRRASPASDVSSTSMIVCLFARAARRAGAAPPPGGSCRRGRGTH